MGAIASQITSLTIVYSTVYSDTDERKHQSSASLAFVRGIHRSPVNFPHKWPVTRKCFHLMTSSCIHYIPRNNCTVCALLCFFVVWYPSVLSYHTGFLHWHWVVVCSWWRHQMETFSALLAISVRNSPVPGEFPAQGPVTRNFDVFFDLRLNKRLSKQSWGWWFETLSRPLWRHCNVRSWNVATLGNSGK